MPAVCKQEPQLRSLNERWGSLDKKMDRMVEALEALAAQRVEIEHLTQQQHEDRVWLKDHETRIQSLERAPGSSASKFLWILIGASVTVAPGIATAILVYWMRGAP
jgi:predicted RNase H-like nuclease (RuvC/YqgF family)